MIDATSELNTNGSTYITDSISDLRTYLEGLITEASTDNLASLAHTNAYLGVIQTQLAAAADATALTEAEATALVTAQKNYLVDTMMSGKLLSLSIWYRFNHPEIIKYLIILEAVIKIFCIKISL